MERRVEAASERVAFERVTEEPERTAEEEPERTVDEERVPTTRREADVPVVPRRTWPELSVLPRRTVWPPFTEEERRVAEDNPRLPTYEERFAP